MVFAFTTTHNLWLSHWRHLRTLSCLTGLAIRAPGCEMLDTSLSVTLYMHKIHIAKLWEFHTRSSTWRPFPPLSLPGLEKRHFGEASSPREREAQDVYLCKKLLVLCTISEGITKRWHPPRREIFAKSWFLAFCCYRGGEGRLAPAQFIFELYDYVCET